MMLAACGSTICQPHLTRLRLPWFASLDDVKTLLQAIREDKACEGDMQLISIIEEIERKIVDCGWLTAKD
jgi:hypothetical protein